MEKYFLALKYIGISYTRNNDTRNKYVLSVSLFDVRNNHTMYKVWSFR